MPKNLPNIQYLLEENTQVIDSDNASYKLIYDKSYDNASYFDNFDSYVGFIKAVERMVRTSDRYKKYIRYLKTEVEMNHCQVLRDVNDEEADINLHHMPFTLYDICAIVLEYFIMKKWKITTFKIANQVLNEHFDNRVGCVMLSTTVHEEYHNGKLWIPWKMVYGNVKKFINKYNDAIGDEYREKINKFIDKSLMYDANDFSVLDLNPNLYKRNKEV